MRALALRWQGLIQGSKLLSFSVSTATLYINEEVISALSDHPFGSARQEPPLYDYLDDRVERSWK